MKEYLLKKISNREIRVGVVGLGYVGLPLAVEKAKAGFQTIGFDVQDTKVHMVNEGHNYIGDVVDSDLKRLVDEKMLVATTDFSFVKDVDFIAICVPTPLDEHQQPDISYVKASTEAISKYLTKNTMVDALARHNAKSTFDELLQLGVVPVVNENDTVATYEIEFGDNDKLSAIVAALIGADLLVLLSDIDGLFTDDPNQNPEAEFIDVVPHITEELAAMGKDANSNVGTGGMASKIAAARIATASGADMVIANARDTDVIYDILRGEKVGTLFLSHKNTDFDLLHYLSD